MSEEAPSGGGSPAPDSPPADRTVVVVSRPPRLPSLKVVILGILLPVLFVGMLLLGQGTWPAIFGALSLLLLILIPTLLWRKGHGGRALAVAGVSSVLVLPLAGISGWEHCYACGTTRSYEDLAWGIDGDTVRLPVAHRIRPTHALADQFPPDHEHTWFFTHEHKWGVLLFNTPLSGGYKACASPYVNPFGWMYEDEAEFRDFVRAKIREGAVTQEQVRTLFSLHRRRVPAIGASDAESAALAKLAGPWIGKPDWHQWWEPAAR